DDRAAHRDAMECGDFLAGARARLEQSYAGARFSARHFRVIMNEHNRPLHDRGADERGLIQVDSRPLTPATAISAGCGGDGEDADTQQRGDATMSPHVRPPLVPEIRQPDPATPSRPQPACRVEILQGVRHAYSVGAGNRVRTGAVATPRAIAWRQRAAARRQGVQHGLRLLPVRLDARAATAPRAGGLAVARANRRG